MNNPDLIIYIVVALLPLSAFLLVVQVNPYDALVVRGTMGAIAALVYAILGAGDVALTEALMGTLLAVSLYVIAVRSSLVMRLGVLKEDLSNLNNGETENVFLSLIDEFKSAISKYYLRLDVIKYKDKKSLEKALENQEVHGIFFVDKLDKITENNIYKTIIRIERLYEILKENSSKINHSLTYQSFVNNNSNH
ncbi:DUF4040 domain-containing protein [Geminocystis sp. CENA526]|uniref:DUF4040 domain-containing protein n=1 Tax=Geminocystis sp. CENA526 TaxID=1355871 RepID=UPI003D6F7DFE